MGYLVLLDEGGGNNLNIFRIRLQHNEKQNAKKNKNWKGLNNITFLNALY